MTVIRTLFITTAVLAVVSCSDDANSAIDAIETAQGIEIGDGEVSLEIDGIEFTTAGSGTITIDGDQELEFDVETCITTEGDTTVAGSIGADAVITLLDQDGTHQISYVDPRGSWIANDAQISVDGDTIYGSGEAQVGGRSGLYAGELAIEVTCGN